MHFSVSVPEFSVIIQVDRTQIDGSRCMALLLFTQFMLQIFYVLE